KAAARHDEKYRRAPAMVGAAGRDALAIVGAEDEARLQVGRHNGDTLRAVHDAIGDRFVGRRHNLAQDGAGSLNAIQGGAAPVRRAGAQGHREYDHSHGKFFHISTPIDTTLSACIADWCHLTLVGCKFEPKKEPGWLLFSVLPAE